MGNHRFDKEAGRQFIRDASALMAQDAKEDALRHNLSSYLSRMFPEQPWWVRAHASCAEAHLQVWRAANTGKPGNGFVDTLVGATAIEYEANIGEQAVLEHALGQVRGYCAGLINNGERAEILIGIVSDTLRWKAFRVSHVYPINHVPGACAFGKDHVVLAEIDDLVCAERDPGALARFLITHLGREGGRPLTAYTLIDDLGFDSTFAVRHLEAITRVIEAAFASRPDYAAMIGRLWSSFLAHLGEDMHSQEGFDRRIYGRELYVMTLAKLLCANVLHGSGLSSTDDELSGILDGDHFKGKGLLNLVEYDYFGWLNAEPHIKSLIPLAREIQADLAAYDFHSPPTEDLFGGLLAQLGGEAQRLLLGQEPTPGWLAEKLVAEVLSDVPAGIDPRLVDMCCGSGAMIVAAVKLVTKGWGGAVRPDRRGVQRLAQAITGFDIDPVAVLLSKVGWVLAAKAWCNAGDFYDIDIPIYHADSLFAVTPLSRAVGENPGDACHELRLDSKVVTLPGCLLAAQHQVLFDTLLQRAYALALAAADSGEIAEGKPALPEECAVLREQHEQELQEFWEGLIRALASLQREGRNGIWHFVLKNSYRPGLVGGQFNGLVSNPPWLALSRIDDNPYKQTLTARASAYGIRPRGASHPHIELATTFLLHAVDKYLVDGGAVGCIVPETILNGRHHEPFRAGCYMSAERPVPFYVDKIWRVPDTFKNQAVVLLGHKGGEPTQPAEIPGECVKKDASETRLFRRIQVGNLTAWSDLAVSGASMGSGSRDQRFRQGADIMPRTVVFHNMVVGSHGNFDISPIDRDSPLQYLVSEAKKHKTFCVRALNVSREFVFRVLLSNHLTPFHLAAPANALLPIKKNAGIWSPATWPEIMATTQNTEMALRRMVRTALDRRTDLGEFFALLNADRGKLTFQRLGKRRWLVVMGAGGGVVCGAHKQITTGDAAELIIDQTLYWAQFNDEDEALYWVGLLNSEALNARVKPFQAAGSFGPRHVHTLPQQIIPPFERGNHRHRAVVVATKGIIIDLAASARKSEAVCNAQSPDSGRLHTRRATIRAALEKLPAYGDYTRACRDAL